MHLQAWQLLALRSESSERCHRLSRAATLRPLVLPSQECSQGARNNPRGIHGHTGKPKNMTVVSSSNPKWAQMLLDTNVGTSTQPCPAADTPAAERLKESLPPVWKCSKAWNRKVI